MKTAEHYIWKAHDALLFNEAMLQIPFPVPESNPVDVKELRAVKYKKQLYQDDVRKIFIYKAIENTRDSVRDPLPNLFHLRRNINIVQLLEVVLKIHTIS